MITIVQERYIPQHLAKKGKSGSHYSVQVDGTVVYRGTLRDCKEKREELQGKHPYSTRGLSQMEGFKQYFLNKSYN